MRSAALLVPLVLLAAGCSDEDDRMYTFGKAAACFQGAGVDVIKGGETTPPTPDARDFTVWDGNRIVYSLVFLKSVGLAKKRSAQLDVPPQPSGLSIPTAKDERRGNVIVITVQEGALPSEPHDRRLLDRCLPKE